MKGLLLKDFYTLGRQMRIFLGLIVVFALLPGDSMYSFAVMYAAMLPYTALAYDERSHWGQLARMLPYTPRQLAASKYLLGWLAVAAATLLSAAGGLIAALTGGDPFARLLGLPAVAGAALLLMAVTLPLMFRFGVERGRIAFLLLLVAFALLIPLAAVYAKTDESAVFWGLAAGLPAAGLIAQPISIAVSGRIMAQER